VSLLVAGDWRTVPRPGGCDVAAHREHLPAARVRQAGRPGRVALAAVVHHSIE
jgi:hypothetical protein